MTFVEALDTYRHAWAAALLIAVSCGVAGVYVVLRRIAFLGIATAQLAAAGVSLALLAHLPPLPAAAAATLLGAGWLASGREGSRVPREGVLGAAFAVASALSILFVFRSSAELDRIEHVVYGSLLFAGAGQVRVLAAGVAGVLLIHALFARGFLMVSLDVETARTLGVPTRPMGLLLVCTIAAVIALSIGTAGSLLAFALLLLPPMTALLLSQRLPAVFALSMLAGGASAGGGMALSVMFDLPTSPTIVVTAAVLLVAAAAARRHRGAGAGLLLAVGIGVAFAAVHPPRTPAEPAGRSDEEPHVDLELAVHRRRVRPGERLELDYVLRVRGTLPGDPHLLITAGSAMGVARIAPDIRAGRVELDTAGLAAGRAYAVTASIWTGDPLAPTVATEVLPAHVCNANELHVEVVQ